jgi:hypothetical protein
MRWRDRIRTLAWHSSDHSIIALPLFLLDPPFPESQQNNELREASGIMRAEREFPESFDRLVYSTQVRGKYLGSLGGSELNLLQSIKEEPQGASYGHKIDA